MTLTFLRSGWWLSLLGAGLFQSQAADGPLSVTVSNSPGSGVTVRLGWKPSPSTNATGYFLNWGLVTGQCTNELDVGNVTNTTVTGLATDTTYYFNIEAYDATGDQSPPSNELACAPPPTLGLQFQRNGTNAPTIGLAFQASAGTTYLIQATEDFQQWVTVWTTNCTTTGLLVYAAADPANYPKRFYRLGRQ